MIRGLGCDVCAISRMQKILENPRFLDRWFTAYEREYIGARKNNAQTAAGLFAAKEAYLKARGSGIDTLALSAIEIAHDERGRPYYRLADACAHLSITHEAGCAAAVCILESGGAKHD